MREETNSRNREEEEEEQQQQQQQQKTDAMRCDAMIRHHMPNPKF